MAVKRFATDEYRIVHNGFLARLESSSQILEFLIDVREPFRDIRGLNFIGVDAILDEHIEVSIVPTRAKL